MAARFTDRQIRSLLKVGKAGRHAVGNGLYFRISNEGTGFWVLRYMIHGKRREMTLGRYPDLSLADAADLAVKHKAQIRQKHDPLVERLREGNNKLQTVDDLASDWLEGYTKRLKKPNAPRRIYYHEIAPYIGRMRVDQVSPRDIRGILKRIADSGRPSVSNDALMHCKQLFRHGIKLDLLQYNPAGAFTREDAGGAEKSRTRFLTWDELNHVFAAFEQHQKQFVRENTLAIALLICLGVRKSELVLASWDEFDLAAKVWSLPAERTKTGVGIKIPLADEVLVWLEELRVRGLGSRYVFPQRKGTKKDGTMALDTLNTALKTMHHEGKLPVEAFTVHDMRRTCRSLLAAQGVPSHVAERCLNHKIRGIEGVYDHYDYFDERKEALSLLAAKFAPLVPPPEDDAVLGVFNKVST